MAYSVQYYTQKFVIGFLFYWLKHVPTLFYTTSDLISVKYIYFGMCKLKDVKVLGLVCVNCSIAPALHEARI
jgi:hypothetical protein